MHLEYHPLYVFNENDKHMIRKELGMKENILQEDIEAILDWFYKQPHLADASINRDYVENMLIAAKGSREKAKKRIDIFYKHRFYSPELVQARIKDLSDLNYDPWTFFFQCAMLSLYNGKRISVLKITDPNPGNFISEIVFRSTVMLADLRLKFDYMLGDIYILDLQHASLGHILRVNPLLMQKFINICQDGIGIRVFEVHIVNASTFSQQLLNSMKRFIKPKTVERVMFHSNMEELHNFIPRQYLPKDFGGEQPSLEDIKGMYRKEMQNPVTRDYLIECCQQISDEKKRMNEKHNEDYMMGSFKKLELD